MSIPDLWYDKSNNPLAMRVQNDLDLKQSDNLPDDNYNMLLMCLYNPKHGILHIELIHAHPLKEIRLYYDWMLLHSSLLLNDIEYNHVGNLALHDSGLL